MSGLISNSWCVKPSLSATLRAKALSSPERSNAWSPSENLIVNECTDCDVRSRISALMIEESSPPLSSTPTGTSATICRSTELRSRSSSLASASASVIVASSRGSIDQYGLTETVASLKVNRCPGGSLKMP
jgi:hypothetical protein